MNHVLWSYPPSLCVGGGVWTTHMCVCRCMRVYGSVCTREYLDAEDNLRCHSQKLSTLFFETEPSLTWGLSVGPTDWPVSSKDYLFPAPPHWDCKHMLSCWVFFFKYYYYFHGAGDLTQVLMVHSNYFNDSTSSASTHPGLFPLSSPLFLTTDGLSPEGGAPLWERIIPSQWILPENILTDPPRVMSLNWLQIKLTMKINYDNPGLVEPVHILGLFVIALKKHHPDFQSGCTNLIFHQQYTHKCCFSRQFAYICCLLS